MLVTNSLPHSFASHPFLKGELLKSVEVKSATSIQARCSVEDRLLRLAKIHSKSNLLHYRPNPDFSLVHFGGLNSSSTADDAFTMSLKALLYMLCSQGSLSSARCLA